MPEDCVAEDCVGSCAWRQEMVESMKPGSVVVDLAAEAGGGCPPPLPLPRVVSSLRHVSTPCCLVHHPTAMTASERSGLRVSVGSRLGFVGGRA